MSINYVGNVDCSSCFFQALFLGGSVGKEVAYSCMMKKTAAFLGNVGSR